MAATAPFKITKRALDGLQPGTSDVVRWDSELKGFGVRLKPSGQGSFIVQYRNRAKQSKRIAFAKIGTLTPEQARDRARKLIVEIKDGGDPASDKRAERDALTVSGLCDQYFEAARLRLVETRFGKPKSEITIAADLGRLARHILPLIGSLPVAEVNRATIQKMVDSISMGKTAATVKTERGKAIVTGGRDAAARAAGLFGGIWTWGAERGLVAENNPVRGVRKSRGRARDRILSPAEIAALGKVLRAEESARPRPVAAVRLLMLTGMRKEEACGLRWAEVDREAQALRLTATKTGASLRPIGKVALAVLGRPTKNSSGFVFPNRAGTASAEVEKIIYGLLRKAGLQDATCHDLRRTFGSMAAELGYADSTVGAMLGHAARSITARHYIRRPDAALVAAADEVSQVIAGLLDSTD